MPSLLLSRLLILPSPTAQETAIQMHCVFHFYSALHFIKHFHMYSIVCSPRCREVVGWLLIIILLSQLKKWKSSSPEQGWFQIQPTASSVLLKLIHFAYRMVLMYFALV